MKRLVSTCHTGSDTGVNRRAGRRETCKHAGTRAAFKRGTNRGNIHISARRYASLLEFTTHAFDGWRFFVIVIKKKKKDPLHLPNALSRTYLRARATGKFRMTKDVPFVMRTNIMYYAPNCFCILLYARTRAPIKSECCCFILPLNVFPIDHCTKDVINNLRA